MEGSTLCVISVIPVVSHTQSCLDHQEEHSESVSSHQQHHQSAQSSQSECQLMMTSAVILRQRRPNKPYHRYQHYWGLLSHSYNTKYSQCIFKWHNRSYYFTLNSQVWPVILIRSYYHRCHLANTAYVQRIRALGHSKQYVARNIWTRWHWVKKLTIKTFSIWVNWS